MGAATSRGTVAAASSPWPNLEGARAMRATLARWAGFVFVTALFVGCQSGGGLSSLAFWNREKAPAGSDWHTTQPPGAPKAIAKPSQNATPNGLNKATSLAGTNGAATRGGKGSDYGTAGKGPVANYGKSVGLPGENDAANALAGGGAGKSYSQGAAGNYPETGNRDRFAETASHNAASADSGKSGNRFGNARDRFANSIDEDRDDGLAGGSKFGRTANDSRFDRTTADARDAYDSRKSKDVADRGGIAPQKGRYGSRSANGGLDSERDLGASSRDDERSAPRTADRRDSEITRSGSRLAPGGLDDVLDGPVRDRRESRDFEIRDEARPSGRADSWDYADAPARPKFEARDNRDNRFRSSAVDSRDDDRAASNANRYSRENDAARSDPRDDVRSSARNDVEASALDTTDDGPSSRVREKYRPGNTKDYEAKSRRSGDREDEEADTSELRRRNATRNSTRDEEELSDDDLPSDPFSKRGSGERTYRR